MNALRKTTGSYSDVYSYSSSRATHYVQSAWRCSHWSGRDSRSCARGGSFFPASAAPSGVGHGRRAQHPGMFSVDKRERRCRFLRLVENV
uniref:Uncharacterized protein n=1 Tax=Trichogramma kaykai TaxID=54128 RepID=A0ABD2XKD9_9HYME